MLVKRVCYLPLRVQSSGGVGISERMGVGAEGGDYCASQFLVTGNSRVNAELVDEIMSLLSYKIRDFVHFLPKIYRCT